MSAVDWHGVIAASLFGSGIGLSIVSVAMGVWTMALVFIPMALVGWWLL